MNGMWFVLGVLCGVAVFFTVVRKGGTADEKTSGKTKHTPTKEWEETRNFLYYDGTVMPEIKEDLN